MGYVKEKIGFDIADPFTSVGKIIEKAAQTIVNTVEAIIKDPLPTILQVAGSYFGIPPYVTSAAITAIKGGSIEDIAKSAAVSYATQKFGDSDFAKGVSNFAKTTGQDFTAGMMKTFDLPADIALSVGKAATAGLNSSFTGGFNALMAGKNIGEGMTSGFTSGAINSGTTSYFNSLKVNPSWGVGTKTFDLIKGSASVALNTLVSGNGNIVQAVGTYLGNAALEMGQSEVTNQFKTKFNIYSKAERDAINQQDARNVVADLYNDGLRAAEKIRTDATTLKVRTTEAVAVAFALKTTVHKLDTCTTNVSPAVVPAVVTIAGPPKVVDSVKVVVPFVTMMK